MDLVTEVSAMSEQSRMRSAIRGHSICQYLSWITSAHIGE